MFNIIYLTFHILHLYSYLMQEINKNAYHNV
jgi:hypothetical protein